MKTMCVFALLTLSSLHLAAQQPGSFQTSDGWTIRGDVNCRGERGVVLLHGGRFTKESRREQAAHLVKAGFRVLASTTKGKLEYSRKREISAWKRTGAVELALDDALERLPMDARL